MLSLLLSWFLCWLLILWRMASQEAINWSSSVDFLYSQPYPYRYGISFSTWSISPNLFFKNTSFEFFGWCPYMQLMRWVTINLLVQKQVSLKLMTFPYFSGLDYFSQHILFMSILCVNATKLMLSTTSWSIYLIT